MRLVLLGDPVDHSLSPDIQNAAMRAAGLPGDYSARTVDADGLRVALRELRDGMIDGANVTMPHKRAAAALCDRLEPLATRAQAVNTLVRIGSSVIGHNTDVAGIRKAWGAAGLPAVGPVLVLGTGGAAAAALLALAGREIVISGRRPGAGAALAAALAVEAAEVEWEMGVSGAVVVNATPLGMHGEGLPASIVREASGLFDMAYGFQPTPAAFDFGERGLPVVEGTDMLLAQAAGSFRLWTGRRADKSAMRRALDSRLLQIRSEKSPRT